MAGNDKTGKSKKIGRAEKKCAEYRSRNNRGATAKARRVMAAIKRKQATPGWKTDDRKAYPINPTRKKRG